MARVLIVDDEPDLVMLLEVMLKQAGFQIVTAGRGEDALDVAGRDDIDLVILDLGLPDMDGTDVVRRIRSWSQVPVIILSGKDSEKQKVEALDAGGDDYVTKPFGVEELLARVRAALRRRSAADPVTAVLRFGSLQIDVSKRLVRKDGAFIHLTPTEYELLHAMVSNAGKLLTHRWLLEKVWGPKATDESQYLRVYVKQLREKLGDRAEAPHLIATETGVGYRWLPEPETG